MKFCQHCGTELLLKQRKNCNNCSLRAKRLRNKLWHALNKDKTRKRNKRTHTTFAYKWNCLKSNAKIEEYELQYQKSILKIY